MGPWLANSKSHFDHWNDPNIPWIQSLESFHFSPVTLVSSTHSSPKVLELPVSICVPPLIYILQRSPHLLYSSPPFPELAAQPQVGHETINHETGRNHQKFIFVFVFTFIFSTWIRNQALVLFDTQMEVVPLVVCMAGRHVSYSRQDPEGRNLTHALVFCVMWHYSSHVSNLVDLWIILSSFNYTNLWKMDRWL